MSAPDPWLRSPEWVDYAEYIAGGSDKFYETRVDKSDDGQWYLTKRWGRRPDFKGGQSNTVMCSTRADAIAQARHVISKKLSEGYERALWPWGSAAMPDFRDPEAVEAWLAQ